MSQKDEELEQYEKDEGVRELITLLQAAQPPSELKAPADFHRRVLERVEQLPARPGVPEQGRQGRSLTADFLFTRLLESFRSLVLHPAFAYSLVLVLSIPVLRTYFMTPTGPTAPGQMTDHTLKEVLEAPTRGGHVTERGQIQQAAETFLRTTYRAAYETGEIEVLARLWLMSEDWRASLTRLFADSRRIAVLLDIDEQAVKTVRNGRVVVPFAHVVTVLDPDGQVSTRGPFFCIADLHVVDDSAGWIIQDVREDPRHSGSCHPT